VLSCLLPPPPPLDGPLIPPTRLCAADHHFTTRGGLAFGSPATPGPSFSPKGGQSCEKKGLCDALTWRSCHAPSSSVLVSFAPKKDCRTQRPHGLWHAAGNGGLPCCWPERSAHCWPERNPHLPPTVDGQSTPHPLYSTRHQCLNSVAPRWMPRLCCAFAPFILSSRRPPRLHPQHADEPADSPCRGRTCPQQPWGSSELASRPMPFAHTFLLVVAQQDLTNLTASGVRCCCAHQPWRRRQQAAVVCPRVVLAGSAFQAALCESKCTCRACIRVHPHGGCVLRWHQTCVLRFVHLCGGCWRRWRLQMPGVVGRAVFACAVAVHGGADVVSLGLTHLSSTSAMLPAPTSLSRASAQPGCQGRAAALRGPACSCRAWCVAASHPPRLLRRCALIDGLLLSARKRFDCRAGPGSPLVSCLRGWFWGSASLLVVGRRRGGWVRAACVQMRSLMCVLLCVQRAGRAMGGGLGSASLCGWRNAPWCVCQSFLLLARAGTWQQQRLPRMHVPYPHVQQACCRSAPGFVDFLQVLDQRCDGQCWVALSVLHSRAAVCRTARPMLPYLPERPTARCTNATRSRAPPSPSPPPSPCVFDAGLHVFGRACPAGASAGQCIRGAC